MPKFKDLTGQRFGKLTVLRRDDQDYISPSGKHTVKWICRCDCGKEISMIRNVLERAKSCGCTRESNIHKNIKKCAVCGKEFYCPPSTNRVTCSDECMRIRKSQTHKGKRHTWSDEAKTRLSCRGQTDNLKLGTDAAKESPNSGAFETNINAKSWVLQGPDGRQYTFRNLALFIREHPEWFPNPQSARTALCTIGGFIDGRVTAEQKRPFFYYKGWTVIKTGMSVVEARKYKAPDIHIDDHADIPN